MGPNTVIETGLQSLTQDVASCLVHFGTDKTQTWLLVRQKQPAGCPAHWSMYRLRDQVLEGESFHENASGGNAALTGRIEVLSYNFHSFVRFGG
jgi:hypothetical protein